MDEKQNIASGSVNASHPLSGISLLLIDDDIDSLELYRYAFEQEGLAVITASTLSAGLKALQKHQPVALITDLILPDGLGFSMIAAARTLAAELNRQIPTLVVTACTQDAARLEATLSGCDKFLLKPVYPDVILDELTQLLRQQQAPT